MTTNKSKNDKNTKNKNTNNRKSKFRKVFNKIIISFFIFGLLSCVVALGYGFAIIKNTPPINVDSVLSLSQPSRFYDSKGDLIDDIPTEKIRYVIESNQIPDALKNAYVAIEDERFYEHNGIDIKRILGALYRDVVYFVTGKGGLQGASTLTQQLIKNTLLSNETTIERKVKEIYLSLQLEKKLSKDQILTAYLNTIPLGGLVYGVEAASKYYFNKSAIDLNIAESAFLAGLTQAPTSYSPYNPANEDDSSSYVNRTLLVLNKMKEHGFISEDELATNSEFIQTKFAKNPEEKYFSNGLKSDVVDYESFVYPALAQVKKDLKDKYKYTDDEISKLLVNGGLKIYTTMDKSIQDSTQSILDNRNNINVDINKGDPTDDLGTPKLQASAVIMDYKTGEVKALIGGRGNQPLRSLNRAYDVNRTIGSTTKPLTVYGPAIDTKIYTAATPIDDIGIPSSFKWNVKNWDNSMDGYVNFRQCLAESKNVPTVLIGDKIGIDTAKSYGEKLGLKYSEENQLAAVTLGAGDIGNTYSLSAAFGTFGNNGIYTEPKLYTKVMDASGKVILEEAPKQTQVFSPQTAYIMLDLLKEPGAAGKMSNGIPVVGKTGTSDNNKDFWFAGVTPYYSGAIWIGYDIPTSMQGYSSSAAKLWSKIMTSAHNGLEYREISTEPSDISKVIVCKDSGKKATDLCYKDQRGNRVSTEMFISGTEPSSFCDIHVTVKVNKNNNKLATEFTPKDLIVERVFIKKPNANPNASDYKYVVPTIKDDTKPEPEKPKPEPEKPKPNPGESKPDSGDNVDEDDLKPNPDDTDNPKPDHGNNDSSDDSDEQNPTNR